MVPSTGEALLILLLAVLPGAMFTFGFERQAGAFKVTFADRVLRFVAVSAAFDLLYALPLYVVRRTVLSDGLDPPRFALLWVAAALALGLPAMAGSVLGGLYSTRTTRDGWHRVRRRLSAAREVRLLEIALGKNPAPRAWDHVFSERTGSYLRIRLQDGGWIGGSFAEASYAGTFPHDGDLFLREAWPVDADGVFGDAPLGYAVYVPAATIAYVEIVPPSEAREDVNA